MSSTNDKEKFKPQIRAIQAEFPEVSDPKYLYKTNNSTKEFINSIEWTEELKNDLMTYIKANQLLVDCLELATVSNRESILERLFLPASLTK